MDAKTAKIIADAEKELAAARAELAAIESGKLPREPRPKNAAKPRRRGRVGMQEVHRPENGMHSSIEGWGGPATTGETRYREDMQPIVMKHVSPFDRPVGDKAPRRVSVIVVDNGGFQQGREMTMTEREADELEADLPTGWYIRTYPIK